ncbi:MAG: ATP-binding protein, partial [Candidatus Korarchaeota archaeon NZ13-K]
ELGKEVRGGELLIELGERRGKIIGMSPEDLTRHVLVAGQTGSGKTTTVKRIVYEAWNMGIPSLIMDSHWEYRNLAFQLGGRVYFNRPGYPQICVNPLVSIPKGEKEVFLVAETLSALLDLTPSQFYLLLKALRRLSDLSSEKNPPNMLDLMLEVKGMVPSSQPEEESRASLVRKLEPLISGGESLFSCDNILSTGFEENLTLLELGDIESDLQKQLISFFILKRVKDRFVREETKSKFPRLIIVMEEAEKLIPRYKDAIGSELINRLFAELRKFGVSLVLVSQGLSEIPEGVVRNTGVKILHRMDSQSDLRIIKPSHGGSNVLERVTALMPGECVLMLPYDVEVLQVRPVDEIPLSRERIDEIIRTNTFYWIQSHL